MNSPGGSPKPKAGLTHEPWRAAIAEGRFFEMTAGKDTFARRYVPASGSLPGQVLPDAAEAGARPRPRDEAVIALYHSHYVALVRTAVLLLGDVATAEDVVQDSFIAMYHGWWRLRDTSSALPYVRRAVMNRARSVLRQRAVAGRHADWPALDVASAEEDALATLARSSVLAALDALSPRQRQVIVLRYYADLSEAQIAGALGVTTGSVKVHATRALDSLRAALR
jgi:RNA polymerase sigma-70 factor (sigma-E family)